VTDVEAAKHAALHLGRESWSYACDCIRCQWEQWWNESDPYSIPMPDQPHPDGEYQGYWDARDFWNSHGHHPRG
jgi:hypothetical protein